MKWGWGNRLFSRTHTFVVSFVFCKLVLRKHRAIILFRCLQRMENLSHKNFCLTLASYLVQREISVKAKCDDTGL